MKIAAPIHQFHTLLSVQDNEVFLCSGNITVIVPAQYIYGNTVQLWDIGFVGWNGDAMHVHQHECHLHVHQVVHGAACLLLQRYLAQQHPQAWCHASEVISIKCGLRNRKHRTYVYSLKIPHP